METAAPPAAKPARVNAKKLVELYESLAAKRAAWSTLWQDIATYVVPRKYPGMGGTVVSPGTDIESRLFDTTAIHAHQTNAAGCMSWMTPQNSPWFAYTPPTVNKDESAKRWLALTSQAAREKLTDNFYEAAHEFFLDRSAFGTACIYAERDAEGEMFFECWPVGTFVIAVNHRKKVDTIVREFKLSANDAVDKFGEENLPGKILKAYKKGGKEGLEEFCFLHFIMPRSKTQQEDKGGNIQQRMPFACYYIAKEGNHLIKESGYPRLPCFVSRYLEWGTGTGGGYGWAPAFSALPASRQLNFLQKNMDALAELMAFPPWLVPDELESEVDHNAGGVTYFSKEVTTDRLPRQMPPLGRYDVGKDRVQERQEEVNKAFHVDLFQMFTNMEKPGQMTAREVAERSAEKLIPFEPTFSRISSEMCTPLLKWVFIEMLQGGEFGPPEAVPQSIFRVENGVAGVIEPKIQFMSRMALELRRLPTVGLWRTIELCDAITKSKGDPSVYDNFDLDKATRDAAITEGVDADIIVPENKVREIRDARAQAQLQAEQMAMMEQAASAAGKVGNIKPDSVVGQQLAA